MDKLSNHIKYPTKIYNFIDELLGENSIYIFGAGSLAETVIKKLEIAGISYVGALVDKKYIKQAAFAQNIKKVYEWESFVTKEPIVIVMAMSDMKRGLELQKNKFVKKIVYPGCVGFENDKLLNECYLDENIELFESIMDKLSDSKSKKVLISWLNACISQYNPLIFPLCEDSVGYFNDSIYDFSKIKTYINIGAYTGDTIDEFTAANSIFERIYAVEIADKFVKYLEEKYQTDRRITVVKKAFWSKEESLVISQCDHANSVGNIIKTSGSGCKTECTTMDNYFTKDKGKIDLISIALRGQEHVLIGAETLIANNHPIIIAKVGFERDGVIKVINTIYRTDSSYKFFLRFKDNRAEELTMYAI